MRCQDLSAMNYNLIQGFIKSLLFVRIIAKASEIGNFDKMTCAGKIRCQDLSAMNYNLIQGIINKIFTFCK